MKSVSYQSGALNVLEIARELPFGCQRSARRHGIDVDELAACISGVLGSDCRLSPLSVRCTYPVFRGERADASTFFVKVGLEQEWRRTASLLADVGESGLFPRLLTREPINYHGMAVFISEWRDAALVFPEDMTERQVDNFVDACVRLSAALQAVRDFEPIAGSPLDPERMYEDVARYVSRHPVAGRLLKGLVSVPAEERTFGARPLAVVHGDFHAKNFGFSGEEFACVFDFDKLTQGLACADLANALVERFSCLGLSAAARRRLGSVARRIFARAPWPRGDFAAACNMLRLQFAARRIRKHPDSAWVALDVLRRDRSICDFLATLNMV